MARKPIKRKRKRLKDIKSFEVAGVPRGANGMQFVIMKEDGSMKLDLNKLTAAHGTIGKIITVCKSGAPSQETLEALSNDLQQAQIALGSMLGDVSQIDPVGIKTRVGAAKALAEALAESTHDLNMQDQLDALLEKIKEVECQVDKIDVQTTQAAPAQQPAEQDAAAKQSQQATSAQAQDAHAAQENQGSGDNADLAPANVAAAAVVNATEDGTTDGDAQGGSDTQDTKDTQDASDASDAPEVDIVTKADLVSFGKELSSGIASGMKEAFAELGTTLKSAVPTATNSRGMLLPSAAGGDADLPLAPKDDPDQYDEKHWGSKYDLNAQN